MLKYASVALCALLVFSCRQTEKPAAASRTGAPGSVQPSDVRNAKVNEVIDKAPQFVDHATLGSDLGPNGIVAKENDRIPVGHAVYLTMVFRESPPGLQASTVWKTLAGQQVSTERKQMNGAKTITFTSSNKLKPGLYKVTGYWGGNVAVEREFEIMGPEEVKKGKKG
jgi:hypothetical protein